MKGNFSLVMPIVCLEFLAIMKNLESCDFSLKFSIVVLQEQDAPGKLVLASELLSLSLALTER